MRRQPRTDGMSTIESIARALAVIEGDEPARALDALYAHVVSRALALARY